MTLAFQILGISDLYWLFSNYYILSLAAEPMITKVPKTSFKPHRFLFSTHQIYAISTLFSLTKQVKDFIQLLETNLQ